MSPSDKFLPDPSEEAADAAARLYDLFGDHALSMAVERLGDGDDATRTMWLSIVKLLLDRAARSDAGDQD